MSQHGLYREHRLVLCKELRASWRPEREAPGPPLSAGSVTELMTPQVQGCTHIKEDEVAQFIWEAAGPRARRAGRPHGKPEAGRAKHSERYLLQETGLEVETVEEWRHVLYRTHLGTNTLQMKKNVPHIFQCSLNIYKHYQYIRSDQKGNLKFQEKLVWVMVVTTMLLY